MSLHNKLNKVKEKGEEKTIALRIPKGKAQILEKLAEYYETNVSSLIREMINNSLKELQKELIVLPEELALDMKREDGSIDKISYLPEVMGFLSQDLELYAFNLKDFSNDKEYEHFVLEDARLSVEHGNSLSASILSPITKKEHYFTKKGKK